MTTEHTPGPWMVWDKDGSIGTVMTADGLMAIAQAQQVEHRSHEIRRANTRLIAAAPDLLLALERITTSYHALLGRTPVRDAAETLAEADAAIAKARGKT